MSPSFTEHTPSRRYLADGPIPAATTCKPLLYNTILGTTLQKEVRGHRTRYGYHLGPGLVIRDTGKEVLEPAEARV